MYVEYLCIECSPDEAIYLEGLADRPIRQERLWRRVRNARESWTDRVVPAGAVEIPLPFRQNLEARFAFRFLEATRRWEPFASFEPHPITVELASKRELAAIRALAAIALETAEQHVVNTEQKYAEFSADLGPGLNREEIERIRAEQGLTEDGLKADFFGQALNEVQMATTVVQAIDQAIGV